MGQSVPIPRTFGIAPEWRRQANSKSDGIQPLISLNPLPPAVVTQYVWHNAVLTTSQSVRQIQCSRLTQRSQPARGSVLGPLLRPGFRSLVPQLCLLRPPHHPHPPFRLPPVSYSWEFLRISFNVVFNIFSIQRLKQILLSGSPLSLSTRFEWWQFALEWPNSYLSDDTLLWNSLTRIWVMTVWFGIS